MHFLLFIFDHTLPFCCKLIEGLCLGFVLLFTQDYLLVCFLDIPSLLHSIKKL